MNKIIHGDCLEKLKELEENSVDSIVTDPPYHLVSIVKRFGKENSAPAKFGTDGAFSRASKGFMGKDWDGVNEEGIGIAQKVELWKECLRVLKPGGHLLAFSGTRTYHRMASAIEDAGFEVRDMIEWVYGSGFPKSLNIGKAIDKINGKPRPTDEFKQFLRDGKKKVGLTSEQIDKEIGTGSGIFSQHYVGNNDQIEYPTKEKYEILKRILQLDDSFDYLIDWAEAEREVIGKKDYSVPSNHLMASNFAEGATDRTTQDITLPATEEAKQWEGWGTALKPAHEPICMARKPLAEKTVAENVLKYGTGGINIDESRVGTEERYNAPAGNKAGGNSLNMSAVGMPQDVDGTTAIGRFPANLLHDNSEEVRDCFPETKSTPRTATIGGTGGVGVSTNFQRGSEISNFSDSGNASRYFKSILYYPKASKSERNKGCEELEEKVGIRTNAPRENEDIKTPTRTNNHPTVKPISLMEYLIKMVTPKGGTVLDPFAGSGSTLVAAKQNGFNYVGIEMTEEYLPIINARLGL